MKPQPPCRQCGRMEYRRTGGILFCAWCGIRKKPLAESHAPGGIMRDAINENEKENSMKTTAYTPGPWKFDETWALIKGPNGEEVAAIHSGVADDTQRQQRPTAAANARLIAMAPELAEALRRLVKAMRYMRKTMEDELEMEDAVKLLARADGFFCDGSWRADESEAGK